MYFLDLHENYLTRWWYVLIRSLLTLILGLLVVFAPETTLNWLLLAVGVALIVDGAMLVIPMFLGKTARHLWKVIVLRETAQIAFGMLFFVKKAVGLYLLAFLLGTLLLFRGIIQLILFVEIHTNVLHRRWLLITAFLFFGLSLLVFADAFLRYTIITDLLGVYLVFEGINHLLAIFRLRSPLPDIETYDRPILMGDSNTDLLPIKRGSLPQPQRERSFLLPHLDTQKYRKILILTPHPDDLEGFVGGLVCRLSGDVVSVIFAGGDKGVWTKTYQAMDKGDFIQIRLDESAEAARLLGVREINYMGYLDHGVPVDEPAIQKTLQQFRLHQPDLIISFEYFGRATPYPHPDHLAMATVVRHAVARYENADQLDYLVVSTLLPNCFVDVTGVRRIKLQALACHISQADLNRLIFPFFEKLFSRLWGVFAGVDYAEGYRLVNIQKLREKLGKSHD
jgi:LmbE family N-acetylglucosaminyl deacetylase/uncharacterized membrane protein HdeD (DUF308 family)